ncbi:EAL domain-containing protein [Moritella dasanensis]|uniref:EAL domain-containing protein n=1 Tax=Moritella dasanensis TaxID=428031 RepID=UPI0003638AEA|nr:EAL domain-containing protein [Moritella dasanensis]
MLLNLSLIKLLFPRNKPVSLWLRLCRRYRRLRLPLLLFVSLYPGVSNALENITLQLKYLHQFQFAGYYAALEKGYYQDAGLDVSILEGLDGSEPERNVLSGKAQYGVGSSSLVLSHSAGKPLVVLSVILQHSPYLLLVPLEDATQAIQHIVGKRVMIAAQADELIAYLHKEAISLESLQQLPHSFDPEDLIQGRVDVFSAYVTNEPDYLDRAGFRYQSYSPRSAGIDFYGDNLFTSRQEIEEYPERVEAFRQASIKGWKYALQHPEEIVDLILAKYSQRNSREHLLYEARQIKPLIESVLVEVGYMNPERWQHIANTYAELGMLPLNYPFKGFLYEPNPPANMFWWYAALLSLIVIIVTISAVYFIIRVKERKQSHEQMAFKNTLLSTQQDASIDGLLAVNSDGLIISVNQRFTAMWQLTPDALTLKTEVELISYVIDKVNEPEAFLKRVHEINQQHLLVNTDEITFKDGHIFERYSAPMIADDGQYYGRLWSFRDITERKEADELIWKQANLDFLTGLPNRYMLHDSLKNELNKAKRSGKSVAILFLDLDHFKEINDTLGHDIGDKLIQDTAKRLRRCVRETDTIARLGGDEFTVVLGELDEFNTVERIANKILNHISQPFQCGDEMVHISSSIGITTYPEDGIAVDTLLKNADQAMYAAKEQGRNGFQYFTSTMQENAIARRNMTNDLRQALAKNQFSLFYQPIINLATGHIVKAEALIRWQHPERGLVSPLDFIAIAEETGMINDIGNWVFQQAVNQLSLWRQTHNDSFQMSINVSPVQFCANSDLHEWFDRLNSLNLPGDALVVEITEGLLMEANHLVTDKLLALRDAGVNVALDDFGTGYSSLSYLKRFDIDYLKIDQSFVRNLKPLSEDLILCEAIIVMAHKLGIKVIAEGVETQEQQQLLIRAGCDYAQGYLYSKAVPAAEFELLLEAGEYTSSR